MKNIDPLKPLGIVPSNFAKDNIENKTEGIPQPIKVVQNLHPSISPVSFKEAKAIVEHTSKEIANIRVCVFEANPIQRIALTIAAINVKVRKSIIVKRKFS